MTDAYTYISKPTDSTYSKVQKSAADYPQYGYAIYGTSKYGIQNNYTNIAKPTGTPYTTVAKPTT